MESSHCIACVSKKACPFLDNCAFSSMWHRVKAAAYKIYDETSMQDLPNTNTSETVPAPPVVG
jgi:DNA-binding IscR family transcriptional regulator